MLLIKNGTILDPYTDINENLDILIDDSGYILQIAQDINCDCEFFDAKNLIISPGFIDVHVHLRNPGAPEKETIETGTKSALSGGYTTIVCMANTNPLIDNSSDLTSLIKLNQTSSINILQCATVTKGFMGKDLVDMDTLKNLGAIGFTDDGVNISSPKTTFSAFCKVEELDSVISLHEEELSLVFNAGVNSSSTFAKNNNLKGALPESENISIARDVALAMNTSAKVNFQHISTKESVDLIALGKKYNPNITCEVTPHHIFLNDDALLTHGTLAKMNPPLRSEADRLALIQGLKNGIIDIIATDHAPHTVDEKNREFLHAPSGIIGLETAFSVSYTALRNELSLCEILKKLTVNPAQLYNLQNKSISVGNKAEITILDINSDKTYDKFYSKSSNSPFLNQTFKGKVCGTIIGDKILYRG